MPGAVSCPKIEVNTWFEGLHNWPDAPSEVEFLRHPHRHRFTVTACMNVTHEDRDIEFLMVKSAIDRYIRNEMTARYKNHFYLRNCGAMSCEKMAGLIAQFLQVMYRVPYVVVTVREDEESAGTVTLAM